MGSRIDARIKILLTILGIVILVILIFWVAKNSNSSFKLHVEDTKIEIVKGDSIVKTFLLETYLDTEVDDFTFIYGFLGHDKSYVIAYISNEAESGSGGPAGKILRINSQTSQAINLGGFTGYVDGEPIFTADGRHYVHRGHVNSGAACTFRNATIHSTEEPLNVFVEPDELKANRQNNDNDIVIVNPHWKSNTVLEFDVYESGCSEYNEQEIESTWQYDLESGKYSLQQTN